MKCIKCNTDNLDTSKFCLNCGSELSKIETNNNTIEKKKISKLKYWILPIILFILPTVSTVILRKFAGNVTYAEFKQTWYYSVKSIISVICPLAFFASFIYAIVMSFKKGE